VAARSKEKALKKGRDREAGSCRRFMETRKKPCSHE